MHSKTTFIESHFTKFRQNVNLLNKTDISISFNQEPNIFICYFSYNTCLELHAHTCCK